MSELPRQDGAAVSGPPYIVSHVNPEVFYGDDHCGHIAPEEVLSRVAVGSLEEAKGAIFVEIADPGGPASTPFSVPRSVARMKAARLPESGGSVSLPDGTRVEVRATTWLGLASGCGMSGQNLCGPRKRTELLAAWNSEHGLGKR